MILISNVWIILGPVIAAQYLLACITLIVLSKRNCTTKSYVLWNIFILAVFFVGSIVFLVYNAIKPRDRTEENPSGNDERPENENKV